MLEFQRRGAVHGGVLLGMVATRVPGKLLWDPAKMEFTNNREANKYVRPVFRKGWEIKSLT